MFRGRPHREDYPRHYAPRGPPGSSPPPHGPYRDDRERDRHYFVPDYHREPAYRRSPPGRRYPSPGREHNRGPMSEFRGSGPPPRDHPPGRRPSPLAPHGSIPIDHSLVITVGNELTLADHRAGVGADPRRVDPRKGPPEHLYDREETDEEYLRALASKGRYPGQDLDVDFHGGSLLFPPRREENSGIVSKEREGYTKPPYDPKDAKRPGYEVDPEGRGYRHMERPPESRRRSCSRGRSRSKARSPSRGKSRGRSPSRGKSRGRSRSTSQGKSRGRSPSRGKSRGRSRSRGKSRGRSRGRSRSHSRSRSRSRGKSSHRRSRSKSRAKSRGRSKSRTRGKSRSRSSSGSNRGRGRGRGGPPDAFDSKTSEGFRELELARRRKEQEELERMEYEISQRGAPGNVAGSVPAPHQSEEVAQMPKKSILKKRIEPEIDQQSIQSDECFSESSLDQRNSILSKETERFLNTLNKGIDSGLFSSLLREAREEGYGQMIQKQMSKSSSSYEEQFEEPYNRVKQEKPVESFGEFLLPHERVSQDGSGFSRILGMMSEFSNPADRKKGYADIEDEEKFLYGENEDEREPAPTPSQSVAAVPRQPSQPNIGQYRESRSGIADCRLSQPGMSLQQHSKNVASLNLLGKAGSGDHLEERSVSSPRQQNQPSLMHRQQSQPMPASEKEAKMGIPHRQLSQPEKVHHQQSQPGSYPPGPHQKSPQEEAAETQDSQEFEKIHDLLKTIGLDIGMAEISKLAARTQERLHGKKPQARSSRYTDRQRDGQGAASGTWDKQRSRSGSSHAKSPDSEYSRSISPPPTMRSSLNEPPSMHRKSEFQLQGDEKKSWGIPVLGDSASQPAVSMSSATMSPTTPQPIPVPANSVHALPGYAQYQPQPPPTPSYPPPGYDQYGNYMSYVPSGWPMYPPAQSHSVPPPQEDHQLPSSHSYLRVIETVNVGKGTTQPLQEESALVHVPVLDNVDTSNRVMLVGSTHQQRVSEEKNNADQKQKVIEEREKLKKERDARMKKKEYLMKELERLRKQQGELLRKKRREKDGHKDPLLVEVSRLQEEVMVQISLIRKEHEAAEKKRSELDKVALILGLHGSDKHRKEPKDSREFQPEKRREKPRSPEKSPVSSSNTTSKESSSSKPAPEKPKSKSPNRSQSPPTSADRYEYYDAGNHWCKNCNTICGSMFDFFTHMHSKTHRKTQDPYDRPWAPKTSNMNSILRTGDKIVLPSKGSEFLIPVIGFYCQLCEEFYGDQICAEDHVTCHIHNVKYKKYIEENPLYEQRRNLDRQAGLAAVMDNKERKRTELKRKMEEEPKTPKEEDRKQKVVMTEEVEEPSSPRELVEKASKHSRGHSSPKPLALPKVKKKPEEPAKPASPAASFGKFSWKKVDKEEEMPGEAPVELEEIGDESKDKDKEEGKAPVAKPKTIEIKLSGKTMIPPSTAWDRFNSMAKIRPNLPVPSMLLRKTNTAPVHKPAPLNTFLSIRPAGSSSSTKPLPIVKNEPKKDVMLTPDLISKAFGGEEVVLKIPALPDKNTPVMPDITTHPVEDVKNPAVAEMETATVANINADYIPKPPSPVMHLMSFESDVAAPGVPESEQTLHVLVRPPPLHKGLRESGLKNEKPKSSLAAAKAQDLYDIFYSTNSRGATDIKCGSIEGAGTKESKSEIGGAKLETQNVGVGVSKILSEAQEQESKMDSSGCGDIRDSGPCDSKVEGNKGETGIQSRESDIPVSEAVSKQEEMGTQNSVECSHSVQSTTDVLKDQTQSVEIISVQGGSDQATGSVAISDSQPCMESIESEHTLRGSDPAIHGDERTKTETCQKQPDSGSEAQSCDTDTAVVSTRKAFEGTDRSNVESLSLATEVPTDTLHGHKHLDPLETRNLMSSDTSLCSPDVNCKDDKNKNHEEVFLEIPDLPESLDLTAPMDEAEPLKVGLVESVMPVDLGGFGNPALSFETADLNLESYDFGFETADLTVPEPDAETVTAEVPGTTNHEETVVIQMHNSGGELCSSGLEEELHILDSVKPDDKETEMHDMAGTLMLEDIGEVVGSFPLESDAVAVASAQLDESSEMRDANPAELWESEKENPSEIKEQSAHQSCQSKDEEHPMEVSLEESSPNDEN